MLWVIIHQYHSSSVIQEVEDNEDLQCCTAAYSTTLSNPCPSGPCLWLCPSSFGPKEHHSRDKGCSPSTSLEKALKQRTGTIHMVPVVKLLCAGTEDYIRTENREKNPRRFLTALQGFHSLKVTSVTFTQLLLPPHSAGMAVAQQHT